MGELSERSGVAIPTIRFYQREGLLPAGRLTSPNQAVYDESHVRRLGLIRAMVEVGEMPIAAVGALFKRLREKDADEYVTLGLTQYALVREPEQPADESAVDELLSELGWEVRAHHPARAALASTIATLHRLGRPELVALLRPYALAAHELAEREVPMLVNDDDLDEKAETVVLINVLGDAMLGALRKLAQEDVTTRARS
ncbi:MerR family transcriptional regulator [Actinoplanes bogorensis]|uniref:MerR family transcriptional regulator n=1 Tax=Paractinoplanes bogorensis TaxID=1610840 RepID=A0ABS5YJU2_9ACTN|nr:MerR family transcriptional regulator [Actinoplanes bogorensis]MBU2663749.1 MerR family transcriptional regulator [Actinoplanes bogorensis]